MPAGRRLEFRIQPVALLIACAIGIAIAVLPAQYSAALIAAAGYLLLLLIQPLFGLGVALLAGPWAALEAIALAGVLPINSGQIFFALAVAGWLAWGMARRRIFLRHTPLNAPLAIFLAVATLSLLEAPSLSYGLNELIKWAELLLVMLMVVDLALNGATGDLTRIGGERQPRHRTTSDAFGAIQHRLKFVIALVLLAGASQALIGIWQFGFRGEGPEHFAILGDYFRAYGTFEQPNPFGGFMGLTAAFALGVLIGAVAPLWPRLSDRLRLRRNLRTTAPAFSWKWATFVGACALLCSAALLLSWSRGAWLGFAAGLAVLVLFLPRRRWVGFALLLAALAVFWVGMQVGLVPSSVAERLISFQEDLRFGDVRGVDINDANYAVLERLAHWQSALNMAGAHPWLGVGFGNYEPAYPDYALINWPDPLGHAHNFYLNILAEVGVIGLLTYLALWGIVFWQSLRLLRLLPWPERGIILGLLASWTVLAVHHLLDNLYVNNVHLHLGVMLGILQLLYIVSKPPRPLSIWNKSEAVAADD
jgi:O-antigen ligase